MAAKSVVDIAIDHIDAQIADLNRARDIITGAAAHDALTTPPPKVRKPRGPNKQKRGLPADDLTGL